MQPYVAVFCLLFTVSCWLFPALPVYRKSMTFRPFIAALLTLPLALSAQTPHLIPVPREYQAGPDQPLPNGVQILCTGCDADDQFAANDLRQTLSDRGIDTGNAGGLRIVLHRADTGLPDAARPEGYTITSAPGTLTLTGATAEGVFYAAQTAKQMVELGDNGLYVLHAATIRDWPAMQYRGLSDDLSRGPLDTLDFQKKIIRTLAAYKDNLYSPYFENTQQYASNPLPAPPGGSISAADARELVAYARQYHILIVPDQEAFGHLRHMLVYEQYQPLAETPHGAVLAPGQPGSLTLISQMFGELAQLYPSPFLHIGADETEDLGLGQTKAAVDSNGLGQVYLDFMQQIDTTLRPLNRRLLFWGDIAQHEPDLLKAMSPEFKRDTIAIGWQYNPNPDGFIKYMKPYTDAGFETWVSPGINNWSRIYPNYNNGLANIQQFTRDGQTMGSTGQLNTLWYDDGEALASNNWYGILFGAAAAWQQGESSIPQFEQTYAQVFHGDRTGKLNEAQLELMAAHELIKSVKLGDGSDMLFWADPWSKDQQDNFNHIRPILHDIRTHAERALTLIAQARAAAPYFESLCQTPGDVCGSRLFAPPPRSSATAGDPSSPTASSSAKVGIERIETALQHRSNICVGIVILNETSRSEDRTPRSTSG
jgi:hexosaminidase